MAYRKGYKFNGLHVNTPGVYTKVISDMINLKTDGAKNIAIIGEAKGGKPHEIMFIDDAEIAKEVVKGGELLTAMLKAYDPVSQTKVGLELGGADLIMAIRANEATKAKTAVTQSKEVEAKVGQVVVSKAATSTGKVTVDGKFTGNENKTFKITIISEGTKDQAAAEYRVDVLGEEESDKILKVSEALTKKEIADGVSVTFAEGTYTKDDSYLIPCTKATKVDEYVYTIESKDWGEENNLISHQLENGTEPGTKMLTIHDSKNDEYEIFDDIGGAFSIQYTGQEKYAAMTIVADGKGNAIKLQTYIGADENSAIVDLDINLDPTQYKSIKKLAEDISAYENYNIKTVAVINSELNVNDLDFAEKVDIKTDLYNVTAVLRDLQKTTKFQSRLVEINVVNREVSNYENYVAQPLQGGSEGKTPASWIKLLDELGRYDIDYIVPLTGDMEIIAECREHCIKMSETKGKERRLVCGGYAGQSPLRAMADVKKLAHPRVQYFGFGAYDLDGKLLPPYIVAAQHAGRAAFLGVESATADVYKILGPENTFEGKDRRDLIDNGVMFFDEEVSEFNHKLFYSKLVWDYTTFSDYDDPLLVERSTGAIADQLSKRIRKELDKFLTGKLTPEGVLESARNRVLSILKEYVKDGIIRAYRNVTMKQIKDKVELSFEVAPNMVTNFTFVDITFYQQDLDLGTIEQ